VKLEQQYGSMNLRVRCDGTHHKAQVLVNGVDHSPTASGVHAMVLSSKDEGDIEVARQASFNLGVGVQQSMQFISFCDNLPSDCVLIVTCADKAGARFMSQAVYDTEHAKPTIIGSPVRSLHCLGAITQQRAHRTTYGDITSTSWKHGDIAPTQQMQRLLELAARRNWECNALQVMIAALTGATECLGLIADAGIDCGKLGMLTQTVPPPPPKQPVDGAAGQEQEHGKGEYQKAESDATQKAPVSVGAGAMLVNELAQMGELHVSTATGATMPIGHFEVRETNKHHDGGAGGSVYTCEWMTNGSSDSSSGSGSASWTDPSTGTSRLPTDLPSRLVLQPAASDFLIGHFYDCHLAAGTGAHDEQPKDFFLECGYLEVNRHPVTREITGIELSVVEKGTGHPASRKGWVRCPMVKAVTE
jgi:hypothetical protein